MYLRTEEQMGKNSNGSMDEDCSAESRSPQKIATVSGFSMYKNLWKYIKEFDPYAVGENIVQNCVCCEDLFCRTQYPVYIVLARTILLKFLIRPLHKFLGRSKGKLKFFDFLCSSPFNFFFRALVFRFFFSSRNLRMKRIPRH